MGDQLALEDQVKELKNEVNKLNVELLQTKIRFDSPAKDLPCYAPFRRADGRIVTSTVVKETDQWYESALLVPHEMLRQNMIEVNYILQTGQIKFDEPWKLMNFFHWYNTRFVKIVHNHHDNEEKIFFPLVKKRVTIPDKTAADHKALIQLLEDVEKLGVAFLKDGGSDTNFVAAAKTLPLLTPKWDELLTMMLPHLAEEEEQMITIIKDAYTKKEIDVIVGKIIQAEGLAGGKIVLPSIAIALESWGTEANRKDFAKDVPAPIKFLLRKYWIPSYEKYHRGVLNSLRAGAPKLIIREKKGWFF